MEKEKKKQKNVNDHEKKAKSAKALYVSKYKHSYQNEREFMEDCFEEEHFLISYHPPGDGNCQFSVICESLECTLELIAQKKLQERRSWSI